MSGEAVTKLINSVYEAEYPTSVDICVHGIRFLCASDIPASLHRLEQYIPLQESPKANIQATMRLYHRHDTSLLDYLEHLATSFLVTRNIETFKGVWHKEYCTKAGGASNIYIYRPLNEDIYIVVRENNCVILVTDYRTEQPERFLLRLLREIVYRMLEDNGAVAFHAALAVVEEEGILIVGPSGSGKTTLLIALLEHMNAAYVTNDRAILLPHKLECGFFPLPMRVGLGTAVNSNSLDRFLTENFASLQRPQSVSSTQVVKYKDSPHIEQGNFQKLELDPEEITNCFKVKRRMDCQLSLIVVPQIKKNSCDPQFVKMTPFEINKILNEERCTPDDPLWVHPWIQPRKNSRKNLRANAIIRIQSVSEKIPAVRFVFGTNSKGVNEILKNKKVHYLQRIFGFIR
jgi:energy-coupling factor transporter ATP-binding protein EcfA2